ncbi:MAG: CRISPR-associated endonuclease Cas3'' [Lysobacter sp.]|nr:MAG: CRISPR-associated endonuclease Cas3'' [Lysobacter sp.]
MQRCYAHSTDRHDKQDWQPLDEHLIGVGARARTAADVFGVGALAEAAGLLHDLGKYTDGFQARLEGKAPKLDHATHGAREIIARYPRIAPVMHLLAYAIAGHHAGLANGRNGEGRRTSLADRLVKALPPLLDDWRSELRLPSEEALVAATMRLKPVPQRAGFQLAFLVRMLFSALVDADYLDTDAFYRRIDGRPFRQDAPPSLDALRDRLDACLAQLAGGGGGEVHRLRQEVLGEVRAGAARAPGLFSLTVPTGGGKTLASMAFALDHAIAHGLRRVIYVIPFTSIIEQNAAVFRRAFADLGEAAVLEHHSALADDPGKAPEAQDKLRRAMENWDAPIVVTTAVQFFESLFADRPSRCRKLHAIAGSVVVLDEAQMLPPALLRPCVAAIDELALNYRTSVVLCTATQPALCREDGFVDGLDGVRELVVDPPALYRRLQRVRVRDIGPCDDADLAQRLRERPQILCIVNSRRHARALYERIADCAGAVHLSTLMHARHRSAVLADVRRRLREGEPCRVVSTSLIEAGVDVDFPCVLRAEAGLDAIAQAAGRCNREGRRPVEDSEVLVFSSSEHAPPHELARYAQAYRTTARHHGQDLLGLDAVRAYFQEMYWQKGDNGLDQKGLLALVKDCRHDNLPFETLAAGFRMIDSPLKPVIVPFAVTADGRVVPDAIAHEALAALEAGDPQRRVGAISRVLQPYLVQLPEPALADLKRYGAVQAVRPERFGDEQFLRLMLPAYYDPRFGVRWEDATEIPPQDCIF